MGKLVNKVAFITGSSKGIGKAVAKELLKQGAVVVINGRNSTVLHETYLELSSIGEVLEIAADVSVEEAFRESLDKIIQTYGHLDVLVLNAGLSSFGLVEETSYRALNQILQVNTMGPFTGARMALPYIRETRGSILFISSLAGLHGLPRSSVYCMSKMALTALAQSLKAEMTGQHVHIGIIYVGFTRNEPDKLAYGPDGSAIPMKGRPAWIQQSREKVAKLIVRNIRRRRFKSVLSPIGFISATGSRYFPRLWQWNMRNVRKSAEKLTVDH